MEFLSTILAVRHILTGMDTCKAVTCGMEAGRRNCCTMDDGGREKGDRPGWVPVDRYSDSLRWFILSHTGTLTRGERLMLVFIIE
jgi:hypothetical protein